MASIKLGSLLSLGSGILKNALASQQSKSMAQDLLKTSKLELRDKKAPTAHMQSDPLEFTNIKFPRDLGNTDQGHYMIFYIISNNHSKFADKQFNEQLLGSAFVTETGTGDQAGDVETTYNVARLRDGRTNTAVKIGRPTKNSVTSTRPTHSVATAAVALYMPPGINVKYSVDNGQTELGMAGLGVKTFAETSGAANDEAQMDAFLAGLQGTGLEATKRLGVGALEAFGAGDVSGAITKVTGFAENPFSEVVFKGVGHRDFSYTYNLTARNKDEVEDINKIITLFKYHMHPSLNFDVAGGRYFKVPSEFEIHYAYQGQLNNYLNKISRCVLTGCEINYGGEEFTTFRQFDNDGAAPVQISMTLSFTEKEIMTKETIAQGY
jgi:hypothetical protein